MEKHVFKNVDLDFYIDSRQTTNNTTEPTFHTFITTSHGSYWTATILPETINVDNYLKLNNCHYKIRFSNWYNKLPYNVILFWGDGDVAERNGTNWCVNFDTVSNNLYNSYSHRFQSRKEINIGYHRIFDLYIVIYNTISIQDKKIYTDVHWESKLTMGSPWWRDWIAYTFTTRIYIELEFDFLLNIILPPIIPKNIEDPNNQKWHFYINYQKQIWFNKLLTNEEINLLPIETKKYDFISCLKTINDLTNINLELNNITLKDKLNNEISSKFITIKYTPIIDGNNDNMLIDKSYCDDLFKIISSVNEETKEKYDDLYYYVVIKGDGILKLNNIEINFKDQQNTHFLLPINQIGLKNSNNDLLGWKNTFDNIKDKLSDQAITAFFSSPLSPFQIAFYNRDNLNKLFHCIPSKEISPTISLLGLYIWNEYLIIPITEEVIKMWIDNNVFVNKTFNYLELINNNPTKLPTKWENEPILFSPQCLITYIKSINNNFNPIGNDLFDLRYQILYMGLITTMLVNNTVMLHLNHFNPQRVLSMSKNELCTTINGELPYKTNAWQDWLDTHQTTQDTSYKIYNLTANQRKDNYESQNYMKMMGMIGSGVNSAVSLGLALGTGGMGLAGSIGYNFLKRLPANIGSGTMDKMKTGRMIDSSISPTMGLVGNLLFGGLVEAKRRDNALKQMNTNNMIDKLNLDSQFENIRLSSGKDFILPSFQSGAFAQDSGLYLYTLEAKQEFKKQIGIDRLMNGVPVNQILNYNNYDNRQIYNIICLNPSFNFVGIFDIIKKGLGNNKLMSKFNREYIEYFMKNYLSGITIFKNYKNWIPQHWKIENNHENDIFNDEDNLDDE